MQAAKLDYITVGIKRSTIEFRIPQFPKPSHKAFLYFRNFRNVLARCFYPSEISETFPQDILMLPKFPKRSRKAFLYFRNFRNVLARHFYASEISETSSQGILMLPKFPKPSRKAFLYFRNFQNVLAMDRKQKEPRKFRGSESSHCEFKIQYHKYLRHL
jgi:hypothetical protein